MGNVRNCLAKLCRKKEVIFLFPDGKTNNKHYFISEIKIFEEYKTWFP